MTYKIVSQARTSLRLLPLVIALSACSGGSNDEGVLAETESQSGGVVNDGRPEADIVQGQAVSNLPEAHMSYVFTASGNPNTSASEMNLPPARVTPGMEMRQLVAGVEFTLSGVTKDAGGNLHTRVTSEMAGYVMHDFSVVVADKNQSSNAVEYQLIDADIAAITGDAPYLRSGDSIDLTLELPSSLQGKELMLSVFADTADHFYFVGDSFQPADVSRTRTIRSTDYHAKRVVKSFDELKSALDNPVFDTLVTFDVENNTLEMTRGVYIDTKVTIEGERGSSVTLKGNLSGNRPMITVMGPQLGPNNEQGRHGELVMRHMKLTNATNSAIYVERGATVFLETVFFEDNKGAYGGAIENGGTLVLNGENVEAARFNTNEAYVDGGAIYNHINGVVLIYNDIQFNGNESIQRGGAIYNAGRITSYQSPDLDFENNSSLNGGAIYTEEKLDLNSSVTVFMGNEANGGSGGAIYNTGEVTIDDGRFEENWASRVGGAIHNEGSNMVLNRTLFTRNHARPGAAINTCGTTLSMRTSLIYNNEFPDEEHDWFGNGINVFASCPSPKQTVNGQGTRQTRSTGDVQLDLEHVTIWNNNGVEGQYGTGINLEPGTSARIKNSIVAMNRGGDLYVSDIHSRDPSSVYLESSNNFFSLLEVFPVGSGDITTDDPFNPLDPLIDFNPQGLPVLSSSSLAVNAGDCVLQESVYGYAEAHDYLGRERIIGGSCDIGAIELTEEELSSVQSDAPGNRLALNDLEPVSYLGAPNVIFPQGDSRLWVSGSAYTAGITGLRLRLNNREWVDYDIQKLIRDNGVFKFNAVHTMEIQDYVIRRLSNGSENLLEVEAEYDDGTIERESEYFFANWDNTDIYNLGAHPDSNSRYHFDFENPNFNWWESGNRAPDSFTVSMEIPVFGNWELEYFGYKVNNEETVLFDRTDLRPLYDEDDRSYYLQIPISGLAPGNNIVTFGTRHSDVKLATISLHFWVE